MWGLILRSLYALLKSFADQVARALIENQQESMRDKDHEIKSLTSRMAISEDEVEQLEGRLRKSQEHDRTEQAIAIMRRTAAAAVETRQE